MQAAPVSVSTASLLAVSFISGSSALGAAAALDLSGTYRATTY